MSSAAVAIAAGLVMLGLAPARAQDPSAFKWTPQQVASAIEQKALASSFANLEAFGHAALAQPAPERFNRLQHVAWILLNQSEFRRFAYWNQLLRAQAQAHGDRRFVMTAELNALRSRYDQGDSAVAARIALIAAHDPDWFVRVEALRTRAYVEIRQAHDAEALKTLAGADDLVPRTDPEAPFAQADIWEVRGLALMDLQDLDGSAEAFGRSQFQYSPQSYPRPDFDGLYDMTALAVQLGRQATAESMYAAHHALAVRSDLPALRTWDRNLCAKVAEGRDEPAGVLACVEGYGQGEGDASLATEILPARAIAYARLGRVKEALADLASLRRLQASKAFEAASFQRLPLLEAEVLSAQGRYIEAFEKLRAAGNAARVQLSQRESAGIRQLISEMDRELEARRVQLLTAQRNSALQRDVIRIQRLLVSLGFLVGAGVLCLMVWQWRIARQLRQARRTAEEASRSKSEFLANMSHEIRTPLNGVVAMADMLPRADLPPRERHMAEIICSSGDTLQRLLSDILDLARIESGKITIDPSPFRLANMLREIGDLFRLRCEEKGIVLDLEIAPSLEGHVLGDCVRVRQVVTNFLSNAVKFTERGRIVLTAERVGSDRARFTVRDTGVGFDMADKQRILGRFQQADSSITRRFGGTGLGLAICCELASLMGGSLDCESAAGEGSAFWFEIPLLAVDLPESEAPAAPCPATASDRRLSILVADDHPTNRRIVELMLAEEAELVSAEDGVQALEAMERQVFDVVLMDMQMPVMDGLTAVREIRRREAERGLGPTAIVMLSANALAEHVADAMRAGANLHLSKPFTTAALFEALDLALDAVEDGRSELAA